MTWRPRGVQWIVIWLALIIAAFSVWLGFDEAYKNVTYGVVGVFNPAPYYLFAAVVVIAAFLIVWMLEPKRNAN